MYELIQLTEYCYYIECPSKIGLIRIDDSRVCLIDSGSDKEVGRKIRQILDANNWHLTAIYNTHAHADHIGGNKYLQSQTKCNIYAPGIQAAFTKYPLLEPSFLYGANPPKELRHKFFLAAESDALELSCETLPKGLQAIALPGHFFDMVGYAYHDEVIFLADSLLSREILDKYQMNVLYNVEQYLATLEKIQQLRAKFFVPSHAKVTEDIIPLAQYNIAKVHDVADTICTLSREPIHFELLLQKLFTHYDLKMNVDQYVLVGTSLRSLLTWLKNTARVEMFFEKNMMLWKSIE